MKHVIYHPIITIQGSEVKLVFRNLILDEMAINIKMLARGKLIRCFETRKKSQQQDMMDMMEMLDELEGEIDE